MVNSQELGPTQQNYTYIVQRGDNLGSIMFSIGLLPIWGDSGFVQKTFKLNNSLVKNDGNIIYPGQQLLLPDKPRLKCNVKSDNNKIRVVKRIRTRRDYNDLFNNPNSPCHVKQNDVPIAQVNIKENIQRKTSSIDNKNDVHKFERYGTFDIIPRISYTKIKAVDVTTKTAGEVFSEAHKGVTLAWHHIWTNSFQTQYFFDYEQQNYAANPGRTLTEDSMTVMNVGINAKYKLKEIFFITSQLTYGEEIFLNAPSPTTLRLDKSNTLKGRIGIDLTLADLSPFSIETGIGAKGILGTDVSNYKSENGFGYYGNITLKQVYKNKIFSGSVEYESINKDTSSFEQDHNHLRFTLGITWELKN